MTSLFRRVAHYAATVVGHANAFLAALVLIVAWFFTGPLFHFSDTWQLVINTATTVITFLMVFLIQNTQNRDSHAIHLKLDELIRASARARNKLLALEEMSDAEMDQLQAEFERLRDVQQRTARAPQPESPQVGAFHIDSQPTKVTHPS